MYDGKKAIYNYSIIKPSVVLDDVRKYLWDIQQRVNKLSDITYGKTFDDYMRDYTIRDLAVYYFIEVGEAINALIHTDAQTASQITDYIDFISFRNVLIHQYRKIDHHIVWAKIEKSLPVLQRDVDALLNESD